MCKADRREQIARIIDREAFDLIEHYRGIPAVIGLDQAERDERTFKAYPGLRKQREAAYQKADAIMALLRN